MNYQEWEQSVPAEIKGDSVWNARAYRLALFLAELSWHDSTKLMGDKRTISLADQLNRSAGAISADIEEGYSRGTEETGRGSTNTPLALLVKRGVGTTKAGTSWENRYPLIECNF